MNKTRLLCMLIIFSFLLSALAACSKNSDIVMQMGEVSIDGRDYSGDGKGFVADCDYVTDDLFKYIYLFLKESNLSNYQQYAAYGYDLTGSADISVGDTEAFWNCKSFFSSSDMTYGQELYESAVGIFESVLILETMAEIYGYKLPDTYYEDRDEYIAQFITSTGLDFLNDATKITDENGDLLGWVKDRWAMQLMGQGISSEEWERVFYLYDNTLTSTISAQLEEKGVIKAEDDSILLKNAKEDYFKSNLKFKYISYFLKVETDSEDSGDSSSDSEEASSDETSDTEASATESSEAESSVDESAEVSSEENSSIDEVSTEESPNDETSADESSDDASTDESSKDEEEELSGKEYNEQLKEKCQKIYEGLLDGSIDVDDEIKKCDIAGQVADYPDGMVGSFSDMQKYFGESVEGLKVGDVKMYNYNGAIHIIVVQELTDKDFEESLAENYRETLRSQSLSEDFKKLYDDYSEFVILNEDLLAKYKEPWKIH